ncbi:MAG: copper homeostasis protein CutC [Blastocatellia bacterium]
MSPILEVIVTSIEDARAAEAGGATRLEIISHYEVGGLTPDRELVRAIVDAVKVPARVMLREEETFFLSETPHAEKKIERLCDLARSFTELPIDGLVFGFLRGGSIDHTTLARLLASAPRVRATFHRAFEELPDPLPAIMELKRHSQIDCILTSGGPEPWAAKLGRFEQWERAARPEIGMLVGGGTDAEAVDLFSRHTGIRAFHLGSAVREGHRLDGRVRADLVRRFSDQIAPE